MRVYKVYVEELQRTAKGNFLDVQAGELCGSDAILPDSEAHNWMTLPNTPVRSMGTCQSVVARGI